jgi:hypothetical protein
MGRIVIACALLCAACQGERGPAGEDGRDGKDGVDGQSGAQGPQGDQGVVGLIGPMGEQGLAGPAGPTGAKGADGARGPSGAPASTSNSVGGGSSYRPAAWVACAAQLDLISGSSLGQDGTADTFVSYSVTKYSNDDSEVRCFAALGAEEAPQFTAYYPSIANGAETAPCEVTLDYPPYPPGGGSPGFWHMEVTNGIPNATYMDADAAQALDGQGFDFAAQNCQAYVMDLGGTWYESTLAEAL